MRFLAWLLLYHVVANRRARLTLTFSGMRVDDLFPFWRLDERIHQREGSGDVLNTV